jgi:hypothetical protein
MRLAFPSWRAIGPSALGLVLTLAVIPAWAQDDPPSLGDLARNLRKDKSQQGPQPPSPQQPFDLSSPASTVIDNDNLTQIMDEAKNARPVRQDKTVFSIDPSTNILKVSSPDVTCSLSFNARATSLLIKPVLVEDLPLAELLKLDGPGAIQDENLQLELFNGTDWDLREVTIGLTLERKPGDNAEMAARARLIPAAQGIAPATIERRSDVTLLYHLKAEAKPFSTTAFHENIGITPGPDEDWRWSIVEAKGIRPSQNRSASDSMQQPLFATPSALITEAPESNNQMSTDRTATDRTPIDPSPAPGSTTVTPAHAAPTPQH